MSPLLVSVTDAVPEPTAEQRWNHWVLKGRDQDRRLFLRAKVLGIGIMATVLANAMYSFVNR